MTNNMQVDPLWEQMMLKKRKGDMLLQTSPRKKYKLPLHAKQDLMGHMDPRALMMEGGDFGSDSILNEHLVRGSRLQILKAGQSSPNDTTAPGATTDEAIAPTGLDVVYGKGKAIQDHVGNIRFRKIVDMHRQSYHAAFRRADKTHISKEIVQWIRSMGGRFLQLDFATGKYHDVGDEAARDKVRAKYPQIIVFLLFCF